MCGAHAAVRSLVSELVEKYERPTVVDMEAGLEHLSRGTIRHVDWALLIIEPYFKSMETGARMNKLAKELGIKHVVAVANKVRGKDDEAALRDFCMSRDIELFHLIPYDDQLIKADRAAKAPLDFDENGIAVRSVNDLVEKLMQTNGMAA